MTTRWMSGVRVVDLSGSRGNGPFRTFLGVCLHVNVDKFGTPDSFFKSNPGQVTPNFQVYNDGSIHQYLPFNWQPWCQVNGNFNYAAIETAGLPNDPLTDHQIKSIARILKVYHGQMGLRLQVANTPGAHGLITHAAGGAAWGGHACPGTIRTGQRGHILDVTRSLLGVAPVSTGPHLRHAWPSWMPEGDYFGLISGPAESHGGVNTREQDAIELIQHRLQALNFAPAFAGWADGIFEKPTHDAVAAWQHKHMPGTEFYGQVWHDDWRHLFTY